MGTLLTFPASSFPPLLILSPNTDASLKQNFLWFPRWDMLFPTLGLWVLLILLAGKLLSKLLPCLYLCLCLQKAFPDLGNSCWVCFLHAPLCIYPIITFPTLYCDCLFISISHYTKLCEAGVLSVSQVLLLLSRAWHVVRTQSTNVYWLSKYMEITH